MDKAAITPELVSLAARLPLPIPEPLAKGAAGCGYPWPWSVYGWLPGEAAETAAITDLNEFAAALARFLAALQRIDPSGGPEPGRHSCFRGGSLAVYDSQTREALAALDGELDSTRAAEVWQETLGATWHGPAVWVHG